MATGSSESRHYWIETLAGPIATLLGIAVAGYSVVYTVNANNDTERIRQAASEKAQRVERAAAMTAQRDEQAASFELAAAQIVMAQRSCTLAIARAKQLVRLFPTRLDRPLFGQLARRPSKKVCAALRRNPPASGADLFGLLELLGLG